MLNYGTDIFRTNTAHTKPEEAYKVRQQLEELDKLRVEHGANVGLKVDLPGPKIRSKNEENITLKPGEEFAVVGSNSDYIDTKQEIPVTDQAFEIIENLEVGSIVKFDDGTIPCKIVKKYDGLLILEHTGNTENTIKPNKGINFPGARLNTSSIGPDDKTFMRAAILSGVVDYFGLSFVNQLSDMHSYNTAFEEIKKEIASLRTQYYNLDHDLINTYYDLVDPNSKISSFMKLRALQKIFRERPLKSAPRRIAKIETMFGVENAEEIVKNSDGILWARGDFGAETEEVVWLRAQLHVRALCKKHNKPFLVATQMFETLGEDKKASRAEATDAGFTVFLRAAAMTSKETAMDDPILVTRVQGELLRDAQRLVFEGLADWQVTAKSNSSYLDSKRNYTRLKHPELPGQDIILIRSDDERTLDELAKIVQNEVIIFVSSRKDLLYKSTFNFAVFGVYAPENQSEKEVLELLSSYRISKK